MKAHPPNPETGSRRNGKPASSYEVTAASLLMLNCEAELPEEM